jgi:hypothetical protein
MTKMIGDNILFAVHTQNMDGEVQEGTVRSLSPSGRFVQIGYGWYAVDRVTVLEVLPQTEPESAPVNQQQAPVQSVPEEPPKE